MVGEPLFEMEFGKMAGEEDEDVIVSLPGDTGAVITKAADAVVVKTGGAAAVAADDPMDDLKNQFASMTRRATVAEQTNQQTAQQLQEATQRLQQAEGQVVSGQLDTVLSGIAAAEAEASSAEKDYIAASEAGDFAAQARAQRKMAGAESRIQRLTEAKDDLEDTAKRRPAAGAQQRQAPPVRRPVADPIEAFLAERSISGKSAAWIRNHPEVVTDPKANARMLAAHELTKVDDIEVESEEYFRRIEEGIKPSVKKVVQEPQRQGNGTRPSSAAASGGAAGGGLNGGTEVRLTKREATSATDGTLVWNYDDPTGQKRWQKGDNIGLAEMARRKHEGMKAGLYDKSATES